MRPIIKVLNSKGDVGYFEDEDGEFIIVGWNHQGNVISYVCTINKFYSFNLETLNNANMNIKLEAKLFQGNYQKIDFELETRTLNIKYGLFSEKIIFNEDFLPTYWENSIGAFEIREYDKFGNVTLIKNHRNKFVKQTYDSETGLDIISYEDSLGNYWDKELMPDITTIPFFNVTSI